MPLISITRLLDAVIGWREFAALNPTDEIVAVLRSERDQSEFIIHTAETGLCHLYRKATWLAATEKWEADKQRSEVRRLKSLLHKEAMAKVIKAMTGMSGGDVSIAEQLANAFRANRANSEATVKQIGDLTPEEVEAFYEKLS